MSPISDALLDLSPNASDLPLIVTNVLSASTVDLEVGTPTRQGLALRVDLGWNHGYSGKDCALTVVLHGGSSTPVVSSDPIIDTFPTYGPDTGAGTTAGTHSIVRPFHTDYRYLRAEVALTVGAASDSPSWSVVEIAVVENVRQAWDRTVNFL
jgi:hypothetical protein